MFSCRTTLFPTQFLWRPVCQYGKNWINGDNVQIYIRTWNPFVWTGKRWMRWNFQKFSIMVVLFCQISKDSEMKEYHQVTASFLVIHLFFEQIQQNIQLLRSIIIINLQYIGLHAWLSDFVCKVHVGLLWCVTHAMLTELIKVSNYRLCTSMYICMSNEHVWAYVCSSYLIFNPRFKYHT